MMNKKRVPVLIIDVILICLAFTTAYLLRYDFAIERLGQDDFLHCFYLVLLVKPAIFIISNMYRSLWRYASLQDAVVIFKAVTFASVVTVLALIFAGEFSHFSRSIFILDGILLFTLVTSSRLAWRLLLESYILPVQEQGRKTLIVGAGQAGNMLLKEIRKQPHAPFQIVGFVDDDPDKAGMRLNNIPILGTTKKLNSLIKKHQIEKVIIAIPAIHGKTVRSVIRSCERAAVKFKILPSLSDLIAGKVMVSQIKDVEIEDLLGREQVALDEFAISGYLSGKKVMVTGAAGSIGSEICRQVARFKPCQLIILDNAETPLFYIEKELAERYPDLRIVPVIADIRDRNRMEWVFDSFAPEVLFHAAAYKHVPMMEYNPAEAVSNNIGGTRLLADLAHRFRVANFVMISTDKAVNPTNIMGTTKRVAELYVQALAKRSSTQFTTVRFGNVLGSNGSVIPIFKEQIRNGGPVTVTDPEVIRYFMTIPEASQLVLQAGCLGNSGEIFVLDMGEPVRIVELAEELIRLSGFVPYEDIDIVFTGLRPGEKLFEELLIAGEGIKPTVHEKIKVLAPILSDFGVLTADIDTLLAAVSNSDHQVLRAILHRLVPEYSSSSVTIKKATPANLSVTHLINISKNRETREILH